MSLYLALTAMLAISASCNLYLVLVALPESHRVADFWRKAYHRQTNKDAKSEEDSLQEPK